MPSPPYPATAHDAVTKKIVITLQPDESVNLVCSGSNGFHSSSKGWFFGDTSEDVEVKPNNMFSYYPFVVETGKSEVFMNVGSDGQPQTFAADNFDITNTGSSATTITVYQIGF